jgi:glycerol-3-phosphate cytidylyltransferase
MRTVITYGTFDLFHIGHLNILKRARSLGDRLIACVSTDEFNSVKGKKSIIPYAHRAEIVGAIGYVDIVIPENDWSQKRRDIADHSVSVFAMGSDWEGKFDDLKDLCEVVYLQRTPEVSSTQLKTLLAPLTAEHVSELRDALETASAIVERLK